MIDIGYNIILTNSFSFDIRFVFLHDCYKFIFCRKIFEYDQDLQIYLNKFSVRKNDQGMLFTFLGFKEWEQKPILEIIEDLNKNWKMKLTREIFDNHKTIALKNLIKANEKLEFRILWKQKYKHYKEDIDIPNNLELMEKLTFEDFLNFSTNILSNSKVETVVFPVR